MRGERPSGSLGCRVKRTLWSSSDDGKATMSRPDIGSEADTILVRQLKGQLAAVSCDLQEERKRNSTLKEEMRKLKTQSLEAVSPCRARFVLVPTDG